tara:strand:- start:2419 stop:2964 length:546 start_codon:yes stop_codon:yes gene_type:complete
MPYSKEELKTVDFYQDFVGRLRTEYLNQLKDFANLHKFRSAVVDLYSFEDIFTGNGIEDVVVTDTVYKDYINEDQQKLQSIKSKSDYPLYTKGKLLDTVLDRTMTELLEVKFAETLPEGLENGDVVSNTDPTDFNKWLIESYQKRLFPDLATFFASDYAFDEVTSIEQSIIDGIPDGDLID